MYTHFFFFFFLNGKLDSGPVLSKTVVLNIGQAGNNLVLGSIKINMHFIFQSFLSYELIVEQSRVSGHLPCESENSNFAL